MIKVVHDDDGAIVDDDDDDGAIDEALDERGR